MSIADGVVVAGYTIVRRVGTGGMGEVYLAQHPRLPRQEALKVLLASVSADPEYRRRFGREADIAGSLWHPHIVAVHDRGEHDGRLWIAMDYVHGTDVARLLRDRYPNGMPPTEALEIVSAIADALDYAHERYLLHRDVKPANILVTDPGLGERRILLADFGIARASGDATALTATNMAVGTALYAAPEQLTGKELDGRADQYELACTAVQLLTGAPPFGDSNPAVVIAHHLSSPPPRLGDRRPDLSRFDEVLAKAMAKEPEQRFDSCRAFAAALAGAGVGMFSATAATQRAITMPTSNDGNRSPSALQRARWVAGAVAALVAVGLVAFLGARLAQPRVAPPPPAKPTRQVPQPPPVIYTEPTVTVTQAAPPPATAPPPRTTRTSSPPTGDLGLATPMSYPRCNGQGVVILGSVTTPGLYAVGVQRLLDAHPGAYYLRTDRSCPSLNQATAQGNPIYAVFTLGGTTQAQVCAAVRAAGDGAYGKWLDTSTDPDDTIPC